MTGPSELPAAAPARGRLARWLTAAGFAVLAFACILGITWGAGFGRDIHVLRVLAAAAVLLTAAFFFTWPGLERRIASVAAAAVVGAAAWWFVPCRPGGMSLVSAVANRDALRMQLGHAQFDEIGNAKGLKQQVDQLAADYSSLAGELRPDLETWAKSMTDLVGEKYRETPFDKYRAALELKSKGKRIADEFPSHRKVLDDEYHQWVRQACQNRIDELQALPPGNWAAFDRSAPARHELARTLSECKEDLIDAERSWIARSASRLASQAMSGMATNPRQARQACKEANDRIRTLKSLDTGPDRFRGSREGLFTVAMDAARFEVRSLILEERYDLAFTVAVRHGFEWLATAQRLGPGERASLDELREGTRHLSERFRLAGSVESAPGPRGRESAPAPRPGNGCGDAPDDAADRKMFEEACELIAQKKYALAVAKLEHLLENKMLPAPVLVAIPGLVTDLRNLESLTGFAIAGPKEKIPDALIQQSLRQELLYAGGALLGAPLQSPLNEVQAHKLLNALAIEFDAAAASQLRVELSARLFLAGKPKAATAMLKGESPNAHARQVLADLRTLILGGGTLANPQIARFVLNRGLEEMPGIQALVPASQRANWQRPQPPSQTETTLEKLLARCRKDAATSAVGEAGRLTKKTADTIAQMRKELGK